MSQNAAVATSNIVFVQCFVSPWEVCRPPPVFIGAAILWHGTTPSSQTHANARNLKTNIRRLTNDLTEIAINAIAYHQLSALRD